MKIAIVISAYNREAGLERVSVEYARGLVGLGHDVTVFAQSVRREAADDGVRFVRVGGARRQIALRAATFPFAATRQVDHDRPDVVLSFGSSYLGSAVVRLPGAHRSWWEVANKEWPATTFEGLRRRLNPHHRIILALDARILGRGRPRWVLAAGRWASDDIARFYPASAGRIGILPDGVNLEEFDFDPAGRERERKGWDAGDDPVVLTVATELRRKGLGTLLRAFKNVRAEMPNARLVIGGKAPPGDVRALAVHHGVNALAVGFIEDLRAAYSGADCLLFPTRFDPWGLPVIEAMACGTPVAVSARAGAAGEVLDGVTGERIGDPSDPLQVAEATLAVLSRPVDRKAVRASIEHLAWDNVVRDLADVLERAASL